MTTLTETKKRVNLDVSFERKNEAKNAGAKWDSVKKVWYIEVSSLEELAEKTGVDILGDSSKNIIFRLHKNSHTFLGLADLQENLFHELIKLFNEAYNQDFQKEDFDTEMKAEFENLIRTKYNNKKEAKIIYAFELETFKNFVAENFDI